VPAFTKCAASSRSTPAITATAYVTSYLLTPSISLRGQHLCHSHRSNESALCHSKRSEESLSQQMCRIIEINARDYRDRVRN
jgi:hypothetical protein